MTSELEPLRAIHLKANETTFTLGSLNTSVLYKFYLSATTVKGSGPNITEEAYTAVDISESCLV